MADLFTAKVEDVKAGTIVEIDGGFTCADAGEYTIQEDENGLYFRCRKGKHFLDGQVHHDDEGLYVGIRLKP